MTRLAAAIALSTVSAFFVATVVVYSLAVTP